MKRLSVLCLIVLLFGAFNFAGEQGRKKFQVELFGGYTAINPEDLNSRPNVHEQGIKFWNDDYYTFLETNNYIQSFQKNQAGGFKTIADAIPFGMRFKYYLFKPLALSFGFKYLSRSASSYAKYHYSALENNGVTSTYMVDWKPLTVYAKGLVPLLGIHFEKEISRAVGLEVYVTGGPLFSRCGFDLEYEREETYDGSITGHSDWIVFEKGKGTGYAIDGGIRLNVKIGKRIGLFLEGGYAYQVVNKLSGPGYEDLDGVVTEWEGDWGLKEYYSARYWGAIDTSIASNYWEEEDKYLWVRGFSLDLSGFQFRLGMSYGF